MAYNKFMAMIPWLTLEEYFKNEKERWTVVAITGSSDERETARGRVAQLMELLNLPDVLDTLYKDEEEEKQNAEG